MLLTPKEISLASHTQICSSYLKTIRAISKNIQPLARSRFGFRN